MRVRTNNTMEFWDSHLDISDLVDLVLSNDQKSQKIKVEDKNQLDISSLDRSEPYRVWLHELYKTMDSLSADVVNNVSIRQCGKLLELLKLVIAELELKLTSTDSFNSSSCESRFWGSVQAMANGCAFSFLDFMKICNFPGANCMGSIPDFSMPSLMDHASSSLEDEFMRNPDLGQHMISLPCSLVEEPNTQLVAYPGAFQNIDIASGIFSQRPASMGESSCSVCMPPAMQAVSMSMSMSVSLSQHTESTQMRFPAILPGKCKRRIQRHHRRLTNYDRLLTNFNISSCSTLPWPSLGPSMNPLMLNNRMTGTSSELLAKNSSRSVDTELQFLLQKELKPSDVGSLGRIILPKRQAEEKLPHLDVKEGVIIAFEDLQSSQIWNLRFRFWPNNKTRMYLLECTGNYVKSHHLQKGDFIILYRNPFTGNYIINSKKTEKREMPSVASVEVSLKDLNSGLDLGNCPTAMHGEPLLVGKEGLGDETKVPDTTSTDIVDMEDPYDLIKGISTFEADERTIDEIFNFD